MFGWSYHNFIATCSQLLYEISRVCNFPYYCGFDPIYCNQLVNMLVNHSLKHGKRVYLLDMLNTFRQLRLYLSSCLPTTTSFPGLDTSLYSNVRGIWCRALLNILFLSLSLCGIQILSTFVAALSISKQYSSVLFVLILYFIFFNTSPLFCAPKVLSLKFDVKVKVAIIFSTTSDGGTTSKFIFWNSLTSVSSLVRRSANLNCITTKSSGPYVGIS